MSNSATQSKWKCHACRCHTDGNLPVAEEHPHIHLKANNEQEQDETQVRDVA
jgi:hypothetical protein